MFQIVTILAVLTSMVWAFFSPIWGWTPLVLNTCIVLFFLLASKKMKWKHVDELSPMANALIQQFGHFYASPHAGRGLSASSSTIQFGAAVVGIVDAFHGFWWGLAIGTVFWFGMSAAAVAFNPTVFLRDPIQQAAHREVIDWIDKRRERA